MAGQQVGDKTQQDVTQACRDIQPWHPPSIDRVPLPTGHQRAVLVVTVPAGANKPYSHKGRYYMRSGASTVDMPDESQVSLVLERAHGWQRWEIESSQRDLGAIDDNEVNAFRNDAVAAGRAGFDADASVADVLRSLNLLGADGGPNRGAIALFGRPDAFAGEYPTLGCRLVAVAGTDLGEEFRDDDLVEGNAFVSLRRAMSFCEEHLFHPVRITGRLQAETGSEIPAAVVREALANSLGHRDYTVAGRVQVRIFSDRLEVRSRAGCTSGSRPPICTCPTARIHGIPTCWAACIGGASWSNSGRERCAWQGCAPTPGSAARSSLLTTRRSPAPSRGAGIGSRPTGRASRSSSQRRPYWRCSRTDLPREADLPPTWESVLRRCARF